MSQFIKLMKQSPWSARLGMLMILVNITAALFAPMIAPFGETEICADVWDSPSATHWLGADNLGRDMFSRMVYGARNTITIAFTISMLAFSIGITTGFIAAVLKGWADQAISRSVDVIMAFPTLIFAVMILSVLGTSIPVLIMVIAVLDATRVFRLSRALAMDIEVMEFVEAARLRGEGLWWVIRHEILPNAMAPLIAEFGLRFCFVFLFISALSFLGLGIQPPTADWGSMVRDNSGAITFGILIPLYPAAAIAFLTIGVNLNVDWFLKISSQIRSN